MGAPVTWTYLVTNTGNVTLTNVTVTDDKVAAAAIDCDGGENTPTDNVIASLAAGAVATCTATGTAAAGQYANTGSATGTPPAGPAPSDTDQSHYFGSAPGLNVTKTVTSVADVNNPPFPLAQPDDVITYSIVVQNTGNTTLTGVSVNDPLLSNLDCDGVAGTPFVTTGFTILVNGSLTCTGSYTVTQADITNEGGGDFDIDNKVTATSNETGPDTAEAAVDIVKPEGGGGGAGGGQPPTDMLAPSDALATVTEGGNPLDGTTSWALWVLLTASLIVSGAWVIRRQRFAEI